MALLNPPELRPSLIVLVVGHLSTRRGARDKFAHVLRCLAPTSLTPDAKHVPEVVKNIGAAVELGMIIRDGDFLEATRDCVAASRAGTDGVIRLLRACVLHPDANSAPWGSQKGARDLTNSLAWLLTLPESKAPSAWNSGRVSAQELQELDFGPRRPSARNSDDGDEDASGWPISNDTRWGSFRRWACSLGFAWVDPAGRLIPDPTPAVREASEVILRGSPELRADSYLEALAGAVPVIDGGRYREHVEANMQKAGERRGTVSPSLSHSLRRLEREGLIKLDDRADSDRISLSDGSTISHLRKNGI